MDMPVKEYNEILYPDLLLKIKGFKDRRRVDEKMLRRIGFSAERGPHLDPKTLPKSEQKYWPIEGDESTKTYQFNDKKEAYKELLDLVQNGSSRN